MKGDIMTISRLRMGTDGKGISTLVTFFGCPLHCKYCANDFCHDAGPYGTPRALYGVEELVSVLKKDEMYHIMTGGGVTFGGGEPLLQAEYIHEVCRKLSPKIKKRIETSLNVPWNLVELLKDDIDEWIIDIKDINPMIYKEYTGVEIYQLLENLEKMAIYFDLNTLHIRVPRIPEYNTKENVDDSVLSIIDLLGVEAEVFDYYKF